MDLQTSRDMRRIINFTMSTYYFQINNMWIPTFSICILAIWHQAKQAFPSFGVSRVLVCLEPTHFFAIMIAIIKDFLNRKVGEDGG